METSHVVSVKNVCSMLVLYSSTAVLTSYFIWSSYYLCSFSHKTRKLFTKYGALHLQSDVDKLYIPRKEGGRVLISIEDCVGWAIRVLEMYVHGSGERLIQATRGDEVDGLEAVSVSKRSKKEKIRRLGEESSTWSVFEAD